MYTYQMSKDNFKFLDYVLQSPPSVGGIVVSIAAFQAVGPGWMPGRRNAFFFLGEMAKY